MEDPEDIVATLEGKCVKQRDRERERVSVCV